MLPGQLMTGYAKAKVAPLSNDNRATDKEEAVYREKREKAEWRYRHWQTHLMRNGKRYVSAVSADTSLASVFSSSVVSRMRGHSG